MTNLFCICPVCLLGVRNTTQAQGRSVFLGCLPQWKAKASRETQAYKSDNNR